MITFSLLSPLLNSVRGVAANNTKEAKIPQEEGNVYRFGLAVCEIFTCRKVPRAVGTAMQQLLTNI